MIEDLRPVYRVITLNRSVMTTGNRGLALKYAASLPTHAVVEDDKFNLIQEFNHGLQN